MNCFYCGAELAAGTFFCPECGRRVSDSLPEPIEATASLRRERAPVAPFELVSSTGQRFSVTGRSLLGRAPRPAADTTYENVFVLVDPGKTVSKSHAELLVVAGELLVVDLRSGNGTIVQVPGAPEVRCEPGAPLPVPRGSRLLLGRQSIEVS